MVVVANEYRKGCQSRCCDVMFAIAITLVLLLIIDIRTTVQSSELENENNNTTTTPAAADGAVSTTTRTNNGYLSPEQLQLYRYRPARKHNPADRAMGAYKCGERPEFDRYFAYPSSKRASKNEDRALYQTFFRPLGVERTRGFVYVEVGAYNGVRESTTRFFDACLGWEGLLIDANPVVYPGLMTARTNAHTMSFAASCSTMEQAHGKQVTVTKTKWSNGGLMFRPDVVNHYQYNAGVPTAQVPCGSLTPAIREIFPTGHVQVMTIDVSGAEALVVQHLDLESLYIELVVIDTAKNDELILAKCRDRMEKAGYHYYNKVLRRVSLFVHPKSQFVAVANDMQARAQGIVPVDTKVAEQ